MDERLNIAVIGAGVAGIVSAHLLSRRHAVTLFEQDGRLGGHTSTVVLDQGPDQGLAVDTGFIVLNDRTYPLFHRFLGELEVPVRSADMSFGYLDEKSGFCWAGTNLNGLFAQRRNLCSPRFWTLLREARRFHREGSEALERGTAATAGLGQWLEQHGFRGPVVEHYIAPMGAAIWSAPYGQILEFPAETYLRFFKNHGLLGLSERPQWQTVAGGSHSYLKAFAARFQGSIRLNSPALVLRHDGHGVELESPAGRERYDAVVLAGHADQSLGALGDADDTERRLLGAWRYQPNDTVLHTDTSLLPKNKRAWASWNYRRPKDGEGACVALSYHMNRLQGLKASREYCVSLNQNERIAPASVVKRFRYTHPVYSAEAVATQKDLPTLNGRRRAWFAGSYFRYGFHEDAVWSANEVGRSFGVTL